MPAVVGMVSVPNAEVAKTITEALVSSGCAACVQAIPMTSTYVWQGEVNVDSEILLLVKTPQDQVERVLDTVRKLHPYDVPEIIFLPVVSGHAPYLDWMREVTSRS
jgi:Uncharacterized protein involved in tolerance to divalent cations